MLRTRWLVTVVLVAAATSLHANLIIPAEFREVVTGATLIVRGTVTDVRTITTPERRVESVATVAVASVMKGEAAAFVSVLVPGGQVGDRRFVRTGAPTFRPGQEAVLFLRRDAAGQWRPVHLGMGVYRVHRDRQTGRARVEPPVVAGWSTATTGPVVRGDVRRQSVAIPEFESLVRLVVAGRSLPSRVQPIDRRIR
ncbi:MAG TPA: hypothetical protein VMM93_06985 [Vicinamibacterales bacterium]|nr:hypothetical protein [Vicinamibacterales bacterium]